MSKLFSPRAWLSLGCFVVVVGEAIAATPANPGNGKTWKADEAGYASTIVPFVKKYCSECHVGAKAKGSFHLDTGLVNQFVDPASREEWSRVVDVLNGHEMPPAKSPQPTLDDVNKVVDWITAESARAELVRRDGAVVLRRMNRDEYRNTIRDLIGIDFDTSSFPQDPPAGGFDNNGSALTMSPLHFRPRVGDWGTSQNGEVEIESQAYADG